MKKKTPLDSKILEVGIVQPLFQNSPGNPVDSFFDCNRHLGRCLYRLWYRTLQYAIIDKK